VTVALRGDPPGEPARPIARGELIGVHGGMSQVVTVDWVVDTGAEITVVRQSVMVQLAWEMDAAGVVGHGTTGDDPIAIGHGPDLVLDGRFRPYPWLGVKEDDEGGDLLGVDTLARLGLTVVWDAASGSGWLL